MGTKCDHHSLEDFGSDSYEESLSSIMFDYWRSYLAVKHIVEVHANNDVKAVLMHIINGMKREERNL